MASTASVTINGLNDVTHEISNTNNRSKKYIPPMKRREMLEDNNAGIRDKNVNIRRLYFDCSNNSSNKENYQAPSFSKGSRHYGFSSGRLKNSFFNTNSYHNNSMSHARNRYRESVTGTEWDVRGGRYWKPESIDDVFQKRSNKLNALNVESYDSIPIGIFGDDSESIEPITSFSDFKDMHPLLSDNISRVQYKEPTPVILANRDLMACAQTGSGKTAAFLCPIINKLLQDGPPPFQNSFPMRVAQPVVLVLSPTRELALQIYQESKKFCFNTGLITSVLYGGSDVKSQIQSLENGCDICVATPGRLVDLISRKSIVLNLIQYLVLDEADRMLDMGFSSQIETIIKESDMPSSKRGRRTIMFSATFPNPIQKLAFQYLHNFIFLTVGRIGSTNMLIKQNLLYTIDRDKPKCLLDVLRNNVNGLILVFVETKKKADSIGEFLCKNGIQASTIHGDKTQYDREYALKKFRNGACSVLVATDVASRGLDINNITHVINYDLPARIDDYVHRIGRTGRAGKEGEAISFIVEQNRSVLPDLLSLLKEAKQKIPRWFENMVENSKANKGFDTLVDSYSYDKNIYRSSAYNRGNGSSNIRYNSGSNNGFVPPRYSSTFQKHISDGHGKKSQRNYLGPHFSKVEEEEDGW